jgi:predicted regulator of Ras-like GTPase activity (Roadblock/LC7/MglB family)
MLKQHTAFHTSASARRGERLVGSLRLMCDRAGFRGALVLDSNGLPLAVHEPAFSNESVAALTVVLDGALKRAAQMLGAGDLVHLSIDINYEDKLVFRRFEAGAAPYFLVVVTPQEVDERAEVELSIDQLGHIIGAT